MLGRGVRVLPVVITFDPSAQRQTSNVSRRRRVTFARWPGGGVVGSPSSLCFWRMASLGVVEVEFEIRVELVECRVVCCQRWVPRCKSCQRRARALGVDSWAKRPSASLQASSAGAVVVTSFRQPYVPLAPLAVQWPSPVSSQWPALWGRVSGAWRRARTIPCACRLGLVDNGIRSGWNISAPP